MEKIITIMMVLAVSFIGCKKEEVLPLPDQEGNIALRDVKSLSLIKKTIRGNWKIHYMYGGFTGNTRIDLQNSWFKYMSNDSMYIIDEGRIWAATIPTFYRAQTVFGFEAWVMDYEVGLGVSDRMYFYGLQKDTLVMGRPTVEPYHFYMTRFP